MDLMKHLHPMTNKEICQIKDINELSGTVDVLTAENLLQSSYRIRDIMAKVAEHIPAGGIFALKEVVAGVEDAWLNTLVASVDSSHIRFHRTDEIIAAASEYFTLDSYLTEKSVYSFSHCNCSINHPKDKSAGEQINSMPARIRDIITPHVHGDKLTVDVTIGTFIWTKN